jgi:hypothetical protein
MATATETSSGLPPAAEEANIQTLTSAMADAQVTDKSESETKSATEGEDKVEEGDSLEDGEIREEEEVDDGKPKTVFDSKKKYNLKVGHAFESMKGSQRTDGLASTINQLDFVL